MKWHHLFHKSRCSFVREDDSLPLLLLRLLIAPLGPCCCWHVEWTASNDDDEPIVSLERPQFWWLRQATQFKRLAALCRCQSKYENGTADPLINAFWMVVCDKAAKWTVGCDILKRAVICFFHFVLFLFKNQLIFDGNAIKMNIFTSCFGTTSVGNEKSNELHSGPLKWFKFNHLPWFAPRSGRDFSIIPGVSSHSDIYRPESTQHVKLVELGLRNLT